MLKNMFQIQFELICKYKVVYTGIQDEIGLILFDGCYTTLHFIAIKFKFYKYNVQ